MTPEEMGKALGAGWEPQRVEMGPGEPPTHHWQRGSVMVGNHDGEWWASANSECSAWFDCPTAEAAIAVAHLLVAAERIAAGAEVAAAEPAEVRWYAGTAEGDWRTGEADERGLVRRGIFGLHPHEARRWALDLLRAADEAEAQP